MRLRQLAASMVPHLLDGGSSAVAVTGSAARGDAGRGSDLDLWVLGRHSDRVHLAVAGTPVTLLRQRPGEARTLDALCLYEVADVVVLADPRGHFARVQSTARSRRLEVREAILAATWDGVRAETSLFDGASDWQRIHGLRQLAFRLAATWLWLRTGWRVPRLRTLRAALPAPALRQLERCLGLPVRPARARALSPALAKGLAAAARTLTGLRARVTPAGRRAPTQQQRQVAGRLSAGLHSLPDSPPRELNARLAAKEWDEAVLLARKFLRRDLLPPLLNGLGVRDLSELSQRPSLAPLAAAFHLAEGLGPKPFDGSARTVERAVARLTCTLGLCARLPTDLRRTLGVTSRGTLRARRH